MNNLYVTGYSLITYVPFFMRLWAPDDGTASRCMERAMLLHTSWASRIWRATLLGSSRRSSSSSSSCSSTTSSRSRVTRITCHTGSPVLAIRELHYERRFVNGRERGEIIRCQLPVIHYPMPTIYDESQSSTLTLSALVWYFYWLGLDSRSRLACNIPHWANVCFHRASIYPLWAWYFFVLIDDDDIWLKYLNHDLYFSTNLTN